MDGAHLVKPDNNGRFRRIGRASKRTMWYQMGNRNACITVMMDVLMIAFMFSTARRL